MKRNVSEDFNSLDFDLRTGSPTVDATYSINIDTETSNVKKGTSVSQKEVVLKHRSTIYIDPPEKVKVDFLNDLFPNRIVEDTRAVEEVLVV